MIHEGHALGLSPLEFNKQIANTNIKDHSVIFVILNHYPYLTHTYCSETLPLYQQWYDRLNITDDDRSLLETYDAILTNSRTSRHRTPPVPHATQEQTPHEDNYHLYQEEQERHRRHHNRTSYTDQSSSPNHLGQIVTQLMSSFTPFLGEGQLNISIDDDSGVQLLNLISNGFNIDLNNLESVKVTLTEDQFNSLERKKYKDILLGVNEEQPYSQCPITGDQFSDDTIVIMLHCGHYFKEEGIRTWLLEHSTNCPCCKADVRDSLPSS